MVDYHYLLHNEITNDVLTTIPDEKLPVLRDLFKKNYPYAIQAYRFINQLIDWKNKKPNTEIRFTCPNGFWEDGTFVAIFAEYTYNIFFFTLEKSCDRLSSALRQTKLIDWSRGPYICALHEDHHDKIMKTLRQNGLIKYSIDSTTWILRKEVAINYDIQIPSDVYISPLRPENVPTINFFWPHSFPGSEYYLNNLIEMNYSFGIFTKKENKLISWILINDFGAHGTLQTLEEFKRKGYAVLLVKILAKKLAADGLDSITNIVRKNIVSQTLFKSVGFEKLNDINWVQFEEIISKNIKVNARL